MEIALGLLWHMHQPYYKDAPDGSYRLPWVRLHAVRGYYDMIAVLRDYPEVRCSFNIVPALVDQILDYTEKGLRDTDFNLSRKPAGELSIDEKEQLLRRFFWCNRATMIEPLPRYASLLEMRGGFTSLTEIEEGLRNFSAADLLDLQVLFNLSWLGFTARRDDGISALLHKGRNFSEADKNYVLDYHLRLMGELLPLYRTALEEGRIDITTSPYYHPIAPLVMNVGNALRCGEVQLPAEAFAQPEDLDAQIAKALALHERVFGRRPSGFWPPEGAVCPELVDVLARHGFDFSLSDEDILFHSLKQPAAGLNRPYAVRHGSAQLKMFFRDRTLSDAIGFVYAQNQPHEAAADFIQRLETRGGEQPAFVSVILDGENPWEHYADSGEGFLRALYENLSQHATLTTRRFCDADAPAAPVVTTLASGSWINHDFAIWIGHEEDRLAWEALARTRRYVASLGASAAEHSWDEIYIAEGSDWFWWYGDEFYSANLQDFDQLFRQHLKNCYSLNDDEPPAWLNQTILRPRDVVPFKPPAGFISPRLDGRITHFFEWRKAGCYLAKAPGLAMRQPDQLLERLLYGFDAANLYLRVDLASWPTETCVTLRLAEPYDVKLRFQLEADHATLTVAAGVHDIALIEASYAEVLEIKVPFATFDAEPGSRIRLRLDVAVAGLEVETHPADGLLALIVPDKSYERKMWYV